MEIIIKQQDMKTQIHFPNDSKNSISGNNISTRSSFKLQWFAVLFLLGFVIPMQVAAQADNCLQAAEITVGTACTYSTYTSVGASNSTTTPLPTCAGFSAACEDVWFTATVPASGHLIIDTQEGTITDGGMAIYTGNNCNSLTLVECDDDDSNNGSMPMIDIATLTPGATVYIRFWEYFGTTGTFGLCAYDGAAGGSTDNSLCNGADPFCTGTTYDFPMGVNSGTGEVGPDYGCLYSTPNPIWYYLQVETAGPIELYMYGSAGADIDFAAWGPFANATDPCTAQLTAGATTPTHDVAGPSADYPSLNMIDCSYDSQDQEWCYIPNAQVGEVYIVLITNYSDSAQNVVFSQTGGTGATDCSIVAPPITNNGPLCEGQTLQLTVSSPVTGATYAWTGPNGFTSTLMNPTIANVTTANAGVYSLIITVGGVSSAPVTTTVEINPFVTPGFNQIGTVCQGDPSPALPAISLNNVTGTWSPATVSTATLGSTSYTFTPDPGQCAYNGSMSVEVINCSVAAPCPDYANTVASANQHCAGQTYYFEVENTACAAFVNFNVVGNWGSADATELTWVVTSNLTGDIIIQDANAANNVNGANFNVASGAIDPNIQGTVFTLTINDSYGDGFNGTGGFIVAQQGGVDIVSQITGLFGATAHVMFFANITISPATITITTPGGPVTQTVTNCRDFKVPVPINNSLFCTTASITLPWVVNCETDGSLLSSGNYTMTIYPNTPDDISDVVDISYNPATCSWVSTWQNDCNLSHLGSIFTITPDPNAPVDACVAHYPETFALQYIGIPSGLACCNTAGPGTAVTYNNTTGTGNAVAASTPFGGINNGAYLTIPASGSGGGATSITLDFDMSGYCFVHPDGAATDFWVTIFVDGMVVYDGMFADPATTASVTLDLTDIPAYDENSVIEVYAYPNTFNTTTPTVYTTFVPGVTCASLDDGEWTASYFNLSVDVTFSEVVPTPAACSYNANENKPCCATVTTPDAAQTICSGDAFSYAAWQTAVTTANSTCLVFSSVTPAGGTVLPDGIFPDGINATAAPVIQTVSAYAYCDMNGNGLIDAGDLYTLLSTYTLTINPAVTPTFTQLGPYCTGDVAGVLPTTSIEGITGTWSPATISTAAGATTVHTFTPTAGQCANTTTMSVVVNVCCPTITCPPDINIVACNQALPAGAATLADFVAAGGTYTNATGISFSDVTVNGCATVTTRTYTASNASACTVTCVQTITRTVDITAPVIGGTLGTSTIEGCDATAAPAAVATVAALELLGITVTDACTADAALVVTSAQTSAGTCPLVITRTYTITDACGNASTAVQTFNIDDNTAPVIGGTLGTSTIEGCAVTDAPAAVTTVAALELLGITVTDACTADGALVVTSAQTTAGTCPLVITRTYTITDACGNASTAVQTINVDDNTAPVIGGTLGTSTIEGCAVTDAPAAVTTVAALELLGITVTDACTADGALVVTSAQTTAGTCPFVITRTYTITDACGNASTAVQTINVDDNTAPVIGGTLTTSNIEGCDATAAPAAVNTVAALEGMGITVTDACTADGALVVTSSQTTAGTCPLVITRTYTITDACGNASTAVQTINVDDNTAPVIGGTLTTSNIEGCDATAAPAAVNTVAALEGMGITVTDACTADGALVVTSSQTTASTCPLVITRTYTITDACGNASTAVQTINVDDNTAPVIGGTLTTSNIEGCDATAAPAAVNTVAALEGMGITVTDACTADGALVVTSSQTTASTCPLVITRTYTITDACGNASTAVQTINIDDTTPPVITTCPAAQTFCSVALGTYTIPIIVATDVCAGAVTYTYTITGASAGGGNGNNASGSFNVGVSNIAWTATDVCGNVATCNTTVTVNETPVLTLVSALCAVDLLTYDVVFTSTTGVITSTAGTVAGTTVTGIPSGTNITITANNSGCITTLDVTAPDCSCLPIAPPTNPNNPVICFGDVTPALTVDAAGAGYQIDWYSTSSGGVAIATNTNSYTPTVTAAGTYTYYTEIVEIATNCKSIRTVVTLTINALPTITCPAPFNVTVCNDPVPAGAMTPAAFVTLGGNTNATGISYSDGAPTIAGCTETTIRTYTATLLGCVSTCTQTLTRIVDITAPTAAAMPDLTFACPSAVTAANINDVTGETDACSAVTVAHVSDGTVPTCNGTFVRTYSLTDACGNTANITQNIIISAPVVVMPAGGSSTVACLAAATVPTPPVVNDNCGRPLTVSAGVGGTDPACAGAKTWTFTYTDCAGATYPWVYTYTISAPVVVIPAGGSSTVACLAAATVPTPPVVNDNCGRPLTVSAGVGGTDPACAGTKTWTFTYTDCAGATYPWVYTYTISAPVVVMPAGGSSTVACLAAATAPTPPVVNDNCGRPLTVSAGVGGTDPACAGTKTWTFTYTDCAGATYPWVYTYTISAPVVVMPAGGSSTVACLAAATVPTPPVVNDNCGRPLTVSAGVGGTDPACAGTKTWTFTYTDCAGATYPWVYTYTISAPVVVMPAGGSSTVACVSAATAPTSPVVTDNCGRTLTVGAAVIGGTYAGCEGTRTYTFPYTDCNGTIYNWVYTYTVETNDFTLPAAGAATVACPDETNTVPTPPAVNDACGNAITPTGPIVSAIPVGSGTRTYTWTYTDCEGNTHDWVFTYTVTAPGVVVPAFGASTVSCPSATNTIPTPPVIYDQCCVVMPVTGPTVTAIPACESTRTYTWTYTDCGGGTHTWDYVYTVDMPDFTMPANTGSTVNCPALTNTAPTAPMVTDFCGNNITPSAPVVGAALTCEGTRTYTYTYTDCAGTSHDWVYTYTVDVPDFTMPANDGSTVACPSATNTAPTLPVVTDACGNTLTAGAPTIGAALTCEGTRTYTYPYTDCAGNTHNWVYTYTVEMDDFTMPANDGSTVNCPTATNTAPALPVVTDACGNTLTPGTPVISAIPTCEGTRTYTYPYTDCEGNTHNWVYTYTVDMPDFTAPVAAGSTVSCPSATNTAPTLPTVTDACGNTLTPGAPVISAALTCEGTRTYTYPYTDCAGNVHNWVYTYTVEFNDFTMPANGTSTVSCIDETDVVPTAPSVQDACGNTLTPSAPTVNTITTCTDDRIYTFTYTDCEGNSHDWTYTYVINNAAPTITSCPADQTFCTTTSGSYTIPLIAATDDCIGTLDYAYSISGATTRTGNGTDASGTFAEGVSTIAWTITDNCGNVSTCNTVVTIEPLPVVSFTADPLAGCDPTTINFTDQSTGNINIWDWEFGDGGISGLENPSHTYSSGTYSVTLTVTTAAGCQSTMTMSNYVTISPNPVASFAASPAVTTEDNPTINFINQSTGASSYVWTFGDGTGSTDYAENPLYTYVGNGSFVVTLWVENAGGCKDSTSLVVVVKPTFTFYLPNTFTPNNDGRNESFRPYGTGWDTDSYSMRIYSRWGELLFYTTDVNHGWDGIMPDGVTEAQQDVYSVTVMIKGLDGADHEYIRAVTVVR